MAYHYITGDFFIELLPLLPLHLVPRSQFEEEQRLGLFYLIKLIRLIRGIELLDVQKIMVHVRAYQKDKLEKFSQQYKNNPDRATGRNGLGEMITVSYILRTMRMVIDILSFSYFLGMGWLILCRILDHFVERDEQGLVLNPEGHFLDNFGLEQ